MASEHRQENPNPPVCTLPVVHEPPGQRPQKMPVPLAQAMIVCDAVHRDQTTGKFFLLGTFSTIATRKIPCRHERLTLFVAITDCIGLTPFVVKLVRVDRERGDDEVLARLVGELTSPDPQLIHELVLQMKDLTFPREGEYRFQLESKGELLLEKRLIVVRRPEE